jgi:hypothetical protein
VINTKSGVIHDENCLCAKCVHDDSETCKNNKAYCPTKKCKWFEDIEGEKEDA